MCFQLSFEDCHTPSDIFQSPIYCPSEGFSDLCTKWSRSGQGGKVSLHLSHQVDRTLSLHAVSTG